MADLPASSAPAGAAPAPQDAIARAWTLLQQNHPVSDILAVLAHITAGQPDFAKAQHVRGACAMREAHPERAADLFIEAIRHGDQSTGVWLNLALAATSIGLPDEPLSMLLDLLKRMSPPQLFPFTLQLLRTLGFTNKDPHPRKDAAFAKLLLPILSILLDRREMDNAMGLEGLLYERYVKLTETEAHFASSMEGIAPLFTKAGHAWREELPALPQPALMPPYRIGFFVHSASMLAHIEVLLNTLKGYAMLDEQPFEPTVYCFSGKSPEMEQALSSLGVRLVMLNELFPDTAASGWERLLRLRGLLSTEGVHELVWVSLVTMLPLAFGMRLAPVQTWWAMKYRSHSNPDIDGYVTGSALTRYGTVGGRRWRMGKLGVDDWYDPAQRARAAEIRAALSGRVVVMTLGRTEKMRDPAYLKATAQILAEHPQAMFLWAGREEPAEVTEVFRAAGVLDRTRFIGWVNTRLYAQVADVFLDTFPFPCGFTLFQAMAAGKPVVIYDSPESVQIGLWSFLRPLVDGDEGTGAERAELRSIMGDATNPLIAVARSPQDYVGYAGRLIADPAVRAAGGEASRRFIARHFSDPRAMGASFTSHFVELIEERRTDRG